MKAKHNYYDRVSQVRVLRGIICSLVLCIGILLVAIFETGHQIEAMQDQLQDMSMEVRLLTD